MLSTDTVPTSMRASVRMMWRSSCSSSKHKRSNFHLLGTCGRIFEHNTNWQVKITNCVSVLTSFVLFRMRALVTVYHFSVICGSGGHTRVRRDCHNCVCSREWCQHLNTLWICFIITSSSSFDFDFHDADTSPPKKEPPITARSAIHSESVPFRKPKASSIVSSFWCFSSLG